MPLILCCQLREVGTVAVGGSRKLIALGGKLNDMLKILTILIFLISHACMFNTFPMGSANGSDAWYTGILGLDGRSIDLLLL